MVRAVPVVQRARQSGSGGAGSTTRPDARRKTNRSAWLRAALTAAGVGLVVYLFRRVDWAEARAYLAMLGPRAPLVLVPYFFVLLSDTLGWQATFAGPAPLSVLWRLRVATEAVMSSLPAGVAVSESLRVVLLRRELGLPIASATANVVVTKLAIAVAQGIFFVAGVAMAASPMASGSRDVAGSAGPARPGAFGWAAAVVFLLTMAGALVVLARGRVLSRAHGLLGRVLGRLSVSARDRFARLEEPIAQIDHGFELLSRLPPTQMARALAFFVAAWFGLGVENWFILSLLGEHGVSLPMATSMEAVVSVVRMGFFFLPGGLGAQEASYYGLLGVSGIPNAEAVAAAFIIVKRAKELVWIAIGYLILFSFPAQARNEAGAPHIGPAEGPAAPASSPVSPSSPPAEPPTAPDVEKGREEKD